MTHAQLVKEVSRKTGESEDVIERMGFQHVETPVKPSWRRVCWQYRRRPRMKKQLALQAKAA